MTLRSVPLDALRPSPNVRARAETWNGRPCLRLDSEGPNALVTAEIDVQDAILEADVAVSPVRAFHGIAWRVRGQEEYEAFYVRPHQAGNPDAVQYTPVFHGVQAWQLYHDEHAWAALPFPIGEWFTIRAVYAGGRAEVRTGPGDDACLAIGELKVPPAAGALGLQVGGEGYRVARVAWAPATEADLSGPPSSPPPAEPGVIEAWMVSDAFAEGEVAGLATVAPSVLAARTWTRLESERSGLANLARVNGLRDERNTAWARVGMRSTSVRRVALDIGFSDRAIVFLNGEPLFAGSDGYRSRDYRFLGSIGWFDTVHLPLRAGDNELLVAVSEDFGGWGLQARLPDPEGIEVVLDPTG
jgi:hypothetical protein